LLRRLCRQVPRRAKPLPGFLMPGTGYPVHSPLPISAPIHR
jgi:hypothetical protein